MKPIIKVCKKHGNLFQEDCYEKKNGSIVCCACNRLHAKKYYNLNRERLIKEKMAYNKIWVKNHPEKQVEYNKKYWIKGTESLNDNYIKDRLKDKNLKYKEIPKELIEAKRAIIQLRRCIREKDGY